MRCAVFGCRNCNNKKLDNGISYYSFPRQEDLLQAWVDFCRRPDKFNTVTSRICCEHFDEIDFERNLQFEMGFRKRSTRKLKPGTVPSYYPEKLVDERVSKSPIIYPSKNKRKCSPLRTEQAIQTVDDDPLFEFVPVDEVEFTDVDEIAQFSDLVQNLQNKIVRLENTVEKLKKENLELSEFKLGAENQHRILQTRLMKVTLEKSNMEKKLSEKLTFGQIKRLKSGI